MKKCLVLFLALTLLLSTGCSKKTGTAKRPDTATNPASSPLFPGKDEGIPFSPAITHVTAKANKVPAILTTLDRGDIVSLIGTYDNDHYTVKTHAGYGLVKKNLVRTQGQAEYETWTGYAYNDSVVYENLNFTGNPILKLNQNTKIDVLEDLDYCYLVQVKGIYGFMDKNGVSKWYFSTGSRSSGNPGQAVQGGVTLLSAVAQSGEVTGEATVLADGTPVVLAYFNRGDKIPMVTGPSLADSRDDHITVYMDDLYAYIPRMLVADPADGLYTPWTGYSLWNGVVYDNFYCLGEPIQRLYTNAQVKVVDTVGSSYVVDINGKIGYVPMEMISRNWVPEGQEKDDDQVPADSSGGNSSDSGSSDSGEWTPPVM